MKLKGGEVARFCAQPPRETRAALIYGEDAGMVAQRRDALLAALLGPDAEAEMRLARMTGAEARADPAAIDAALRAQGFFPGPRAVVVTAATDGMAETLAAAIEDAARPDAFLLVTADSLTARSALRALFEAARHAAAAPCYAEAPDARALAEMLRAAGVAPQPDATAVLEDVARDMARGALAQLVEVIALYKRGDPAPLSVEDIAACAPQAGGGALDAALDAVLEGGPRAVRRDLARLAAQGTGPTEIVIAAARRFRQMHALAAALERGQGPAQAALMRINPPSRRDRAAAQARRWGVARLERALATLYETDAGLRGGARGPGLAMLERALLRIAS